MSDETIIERINNLVQEEHKIRSSPPAGGASEPSAAVRLQSIEAELDQCWDLLRQRRAKREFNDDPQEAGARPFPKVEGYIQ
ncbi:DUF2630 family protein [Arthrobacter frigidicola]|nr:DUF2630 family protein [Arthrobacter frigidicola]